jgi:hypothetical protein
LIGRLGKKKAILTFNEKDRSTSFDRTRGDMAKEEFVKRYKPVFGVEMKRIWAL